MASDGFVNYSPEQLDDASKAHLVDIKSAMDTVGLVQAVEGTTDYEIERGGTKIGRAGQEYSVVITDPEDYVAGNGETKEGSGGSMLMFTGDTLHVYVAHIIFNGESGGKEVAIKHPQLPGFLGQLATSLHTELG